MLSATGRKYLRGPRGTGFLYVRRDTIERLEPPFIDLQAASWIDADTYVIRDDARRFENWERYVAGQIGLGRRRPLRAPGWASTRSRPGSRRSRRCSAGSSRSGPASPCTISEWSSAGSSPFSRPAKRRTATRDRLRAIGHQRPHTQPAPSRLDLPARGFDALVRASVHYYNDEAEVERFVRAVAG